MGKRIVPLNVLEQQIKRYQDLLKDKKGGRMPNGSAQFEYNGVIYTLKKNPDHRLGWQAVPAWRESRDAATRRGKAKNQRVKSGSIEQMMVDNIYQEAQDRNLVVDHDIPIQRGGPSNAPWNLKLRTPEVNGSKGNKIGGNYPAEPLIADNNNPLAKLTDTVRQPPRATRDVTQPNPSNSPLAALAEATRTVRSPRPRLPVKYGASMIAEYGDAALELADRFTDGKASKAVNGAINGVVQGAMNAYKNGSKKYKDGDYFDTM